MTANLNHWSQELDRISIRTSAELAKYLLERHSIATLPADAFGVPERTLSLRLATSYLDMEKDADSERLLKLYRANMTDEEFMSRTHHPCTHAAIEGFANFVASLQS